MILLFFPKMMMTYFCCIENFSNAGISKLFELNGTLKKFFIFCGTPGYFLYDDRGCLYKKNIIEIILI